MESELSVDAHRLAVLPIAYLGEQQEPFDRCREDEDGALDESYRDVFHTGTWLYALYSYGVLVREHLGDSTADAVWAHQQLLLSDGASEADDGIGRVFELIRQVSCSAPSRTPKAPGEVAVPVELTIAVSLLLNLPDSPDYASRAAGAAEQQINRLQPAIYWRLASCLSHCRQEIVNTFFSTLACAGPLLQ